MTSGSDYVFPVPSSSEYGLTKRELFAAMAMQGLVTNGNINVNGKRIAEATEYAKAAVAIADALIEALNVKE
jgi:hypothetical protein